MSFDGLQWATRLQGTPAAYYALSPYAASGEGEIDITDNEILRVIEKFDEHGDPEWWRVERSDGVVGIVPSTYLESVPPSADAAYYMAHMRQMKRADSFESVLNRPATPPAVVANNTSTTSTGSGGPPAVPPPYPTSYPSSSQDKVAQEEAVRKASTTSSTSASGDLLALPDLKRTPSSVSTEDYEAGDAEPTTLTTLDPRVYESADFIQINLSNPRKTGTITKVVTWVVTTQTNLKNFSNKGFSIRRKYEDFVWLHSYLEGDCPDTIVPPLPEAAGKMSALRGGIDDHWIFKRTVAANCFLTRLGNHKKFREHPMFRLLLEGTAAELKRAKKAKLAKKETFKHPSDAKKPDRDEKLLKAEKHYEALLKAIKELKVKSETHIKNYKEAGTSSSHYHATWQALAENEQHDTYLKRTMGVLASEMKTLESTNAQQNMDLEKKYRQDLKNIIQYIKEALAYIQRIYDLEDTVAYWTLANQNKRESLSHKEATLNVISQSTMPPQPKAVDMKDGQDAVAAAAAAAKMEKKEMSEYKKQQAKQKDLNKKINVLEKKVALTAEAAEEATKRLEGTRAVMWDELTNFDLQKEVELQDMHRDYVASKIAAHQQAIQHFSTLYGEVRKPIDPSARSVRG